MAFSYLAVIFFFLSTTSLTAVATVPFNNTFRFYNAGMLGDFSNEYDATYRPFIFGSGPFQYCFYNTTPHAYTLALRMGTTHSESFRVWVWEANRGDPVGDNAVFALLRNGNLVLADADDRIVWQSNTADKGVVSYETLVNGNLVLYDAKKNVIWQSFDHPTDTLLVDQYLKLGGPMKLVGRASPELNADGPYSLEMEPAGLSMYYTSPLDSKRYKYFSSSKWFPVVKGPLKQITLSTKPKKYDQRAYEISFDNQAANPTSGKFIFSNPKFNPLFSYMRLEIDGNLRIYVYDILADDHEWATVFTLFSRDSKWASECDLPSRCGGFGLCRDNMCVACPSGRVKPPTGPLLAWNKNCSTEKVSCSENAIGYYQLVGVDHFSMQYAAGDGPVTQDAC